MLFGKNSVWSSLNFGKDGGFRFEVCCFCCYFSFVSKSVCYSDNFVCGEFGCVGGYVDGLIFIWCFRDSGFEEDVFCFGVE